MNTRYSDTHLGRGWIRCCGCAEHEEVPARRVSGKLRWEWASSAVLQGGSGLDVQARWGQRVPSPGSAFLQTTGKMSTSWQCDD